MSQEKKSNWLELDTDDTDESDNEYNFDEDQVIDNNNNNIENQLKSLSLENIRPGAYKIPKVTKNSFNADEFEEWDGPCSKNEYNNVELSDINRQYSYPIPKNAPYCVWLGNLPASSQDKHIREYFIKFLNIIPKDIRFGRKKHSHTCAYVDFKNVNDLKKALKIIHGENPPLFMNRKLDIDINEGIQVNRDAAVNATSPNTNNHYKFDDEEINNNNKDYYQNEYYDDEFYDSRHSKHQRGGKPRSKFKSTNYLKKKNISKTRNNYNTNTMIKSRSFSDDNNNNRYYNNNVEDLVQISKSKSVSKQQNSSIVYDPINNGPTPKKILQRTKNKQDSKFDEKFEEKNIEIKKPRFPTREEAFLTTQKKKKNFSKYKDDEFNNYDYQYSYPKKQTMNASLSLPYHTKKRGAKKHNKYYDNEYNDDYYTKRSYNNKKYDEKYNDSTYYDEYNTYDNSSNKSFRKPKRNEYHSQLPRPRRNKRNYSAHY